MSEIRVDNITDEAGTGSPEIVDHYKKSNILGTVSESGGVPTGAIIERGSNSNGEYVRFADGTQKCWEILIGGTNSSSGLASWTFPVSFTEINRDGITVTPHILASELDSSVDSDISNLRPVVLLSGSLNNNGGTFRSNHDSNTSNNNSFSATAIGRWY